MKIKTLQINKVNLLYNCYSVKMYSVIMDMVHSSTRSFYAQGFEDILKGNK